MCGLVFVGGNVLSSTNVDKFEQLLYADTFRGEHSTGVMSYFAPANRDPVLMTEKKAVPGDVFIRQGLLKPVSELRIPSVHGTPNVFTTCNPKFMVGHNRYATAGAVNDRNAHPFTHGDITLVHNGSLVDQTLLPDHKQFEVDSENVCHSINKIGFEETLKKLHGAFVLIWHNAADNTLNFIRNDERPFYMLETTAGDWYGASEKDMLKWILTRKKYSPAVKKEFELEVGTQYVFDLSGGTFKFKEERKHTLPTFRTAYRAANNGWARGYNYGYDYDDYDDYDYRGNRGTSQSNATSHVANAVRQAAGQGRQGTSSQNQGASQEKHTQLNELLDQHSIAIRVGERIHFEAFQFDPYAKNKERGQMTGYTGSGEYVEVQAHGVATRDYKTDTAYSGKVISCYESNYILTIIVSDAVEIPGTAIPQSKDLDDEDDLPSIVANLSKELDLLPGPTTVSTSKNIVSDKPEDSDLYPEEDDEEEDGQMIDITRDGNAYTKKEWESDDSLNTCGNCGSPIPFEDIVDTSVLCGFSYCGGCVDAGLVEGLEPLVEKEVNGLGEMRFECNSCGEELPVDAESSEECVCLQCHEKNRFRAANSNVTQMDGFRKTLQNGMKVTLVQWESMNDCRWCGTKVPFYDAAQTAMQANSVCCKACNRKFEDGEWPHRK